MQFKNIFKVIALLTVTSAAFAQVQDGYEYQSEFTWGINKNTSGGLIGGFVLKKSIKINEKTFQTFGLEIMNVKHPQEIRFRSYIGNMYSFGKTNYLYAFRLQYGRDYILFKKAPQQGVEIKAVFAAGPSIGVETPYYVEWGNNNGSITVREQYNPSISSGTILGPGRLFQGVPESNIVIGGNFKAALNFELGAFKSQVTGFEAGFLVDAYTRKIEIMAEAKNQAVFPTLFLTIFYGSRK